MALSYPLFSATGWSNLELAGGDTSPNGNCCCVFFLKLDFSSPSVFLEDSCLFFFWGVASSVVQVCCQTWSFSPTCKVYQTHRPIPITSTHE